MICLKYPEYEQMHELEGVSADHDYSYINQPSISEHDQNKHYNDWTALIELTRDAWLETVKTKPSNAIQIAEHWWTINYPIFKRLVLFAAAHGKLFPAKQALDWLLEDSSKWLWSEETKRESIQLLIALSSRLEPKDMGKLSNAILKGIPERKHWDDIEPDRKKRIVDYSIWLRLSKLKSVNVNLDQAANAKLEELENEYPDWRLAYDERDEFASWSSSDNEFTKFLSAPREKEDLVEWLKKNPTHDFWQDDDWLEMCRKDFATTSAALLCLVEENIWPRDRWREAFQAWAEEKLLEPSWKKIASVIVNAPDDVLQHIVYSVSWWLRIQAKVFEGQKDSFFELCKRIIKLDFSANDDADKDPVFLAINHPIGHVAEALINWFYRQSPKDDGGLPEEIKEFLSEFTKPDNEQYYYARVILGANVINLFRVDSAWTTNNLLPLFDWHRFPNEAKNTWCGYLWTPRIYMPLLEALKTAFLETARHFQTIEKYGEQYVAVLTNVALMSDEAFQKNELATATSNLPEKGLQIVPKILSQALQGAGDKKPEYWDNRIIPYFRYIWPKATEIITASVSREFAFLCIAAGEQFEDAVERFNHLLQPNEQPSFLLHQLDSSGLATESPETTLKLLDKLIPDNPRWLSGQLRSSLDAIKDSRPALETDRRYMRLDTISRQSEN